MASPTTEKQQTKELTRRDLIERVRFTFTQKRGCVAMSVVAGDDFYDLIMAEPENHFRDGIESNHRGDPVFLFGGRQIPLTRCSNLLKADLYVTFKADLKLPEGLCYIPAVKPEPELPEVKSWKYVDGQDMDGLMMCYRCWHVQHVPERVTYMGMLVKCKNPECGVRDQYYQHKLHYTDPHHREWPYDDPTVPCDV